MTSTLPEQLLAQAQAGGNPLPLLEYLERDLARKEARLLRSIQRGVHKKVVSKIIHEIEVLHDEIRWRRVAHAY